MHVAISPSFPDNITPKAVCKPLPEIVITSAPNTPKPALKALPDASRPSAPHTPKRKKASKHIDLEVKFGQYHHKDCDVFQVVGFILNNVQLCQIASSFMEGHVTELPLAFSILKEQCEKTGIDLTAIERAGEEPKVLVEFLEFETVTGIPLSEVALLPVTLGVRKWLKKNGVRDADNLELYHHFHNNNLNRMPLKQILGIKLKKDHILLIYEIFLTRIHRILKRRNISEQFRYVEKATLDLGFRGLAPDRFMLLHEMTIPPYGTGEVILAVMESGSSRPLSVEKYQDSPAVAKARSWIRQCGLIDAVNAELVQSGQGEIR
ncbi:hypothetical protein BDQ12DRAFT_760049 [Crucibulum laeve]|uniref:Uncharacterized protein n=1 Tax=Crucibulum laeve TaxID=68775 RepID=A0A5C3M2S7_9AGAR|nr:hypothetical protein BDQ12DRAFT_760049 [Crucibulum laeve]